MAVKGDPWAVNKLLSRPIIEPEAEPYWLAFLDLAADRPRDTIPTGLGGSLSLPLKIKPKAIRKAADRLGYEAQAAEDFMRIMRGLDETYVETEAERIGRQVQRDAQKAKSTARR